MVFAITLVGLHVMALAVAGIDPAVAPSVFAISQSCLAVVAMAYGPTRRAALNLIAQYWIAAAAFFAVVALTAWQAGLLGAPASALNPFAAQAQVWTLAALPLAILVPAAAAGAADRRPLVEAFLVGCLAFAGLDIGRKLQAGPEQTLLGSPHETATVYALAVIFAVFAGYDAVRSPPRDRAHSRVSMRLMMPGAALGAALLGLILCNQPLTLAATLAGLGAMALALALREFPRRLALVNAPAGLGCIGLAIGLFAIFGAPDDPFGVGDFGDAFATATKGAFGLGSGAEGGPVMTWLVEAGLLGAAALALAGFVFAARLAFSGDRRKAPSRGFGLVAGAFTTTLLAGTGGLTAAVAATLAILIGVAASYNDRLRQAQRTPEAKRAVAQPAPVEAEAAA